MSRPPCPIPQVEEALSPYISTRQETTRIRQALTEYLKRHLQDELPLSHLSLTCPPPSLKATSTSIPSGGLYKQYLEALTAHQRAQERYNSIKAEIQDLHEEQSRAQTRQSTSSNNESVREYIQLLRQRRQHRKLEIIQDAVTRLVESDSNPTHVDLKASVREKLGDPPQPPMASLDQNDADSKVEDLTFRLKKELLIAKNRLVDAKAAKGVAESESFSREPPSLEEKVEALRKARDELISWVEGELAKIPESDGDVSQAEISFISDEATPSHEEISDEDLTARVENYYHRYAVAREKLIANVEATIAASTQRPTVEMSSPQSPVALQQKARASTDTHLATNLLPYLPLLLTTQTSSTSLQAQTTHLRRQLNLSSTETSKTIQRLAGESYLVPQGATDMGAWAQAADESKGNTNEFVLEQVEAGEESIVKAKGVLGVLSGRKEALGKMRGDL